MNLTYRYLKGSPLTSAEADNNVSELENAANNILLKRSISRILVDDVLGRIVEKVNDGFGFTVSENQSPVLLYGFKGYNIFPGGSTVFVPTHKVKALFGGGKGVWGDNGGSGVGTPITAAMLDNYPLENITPEDIENDPDSPVIPLGIVADVAGFITAANAVERDFTDITKSYYFSYSIGSVLYFALFQGAYGTYGGTTGNDFEAADFTTTTTSEVTPGPATPSLQDVATVNPVSNIAPIIVDESTDTKTEYGGGVMKTTGPNNRTVGLKANEPAVNGVTVSPLFFFST